MNFPTTEWASASPDLSTLDNHVLTNLEFVYKSETNQFQPLELLLQQRSENVWTLISRDTADKPRKRVLLHNPIRVASLVGIDAHKKR